MNDEKVTVAIVFPPDQAPPTSSNTCTSASKSSPSKDKSPGPICVRSRLLRKLIWRGPVGVKELVLQVTLARGGHMAIAKQHVERVQVALGVVDSIDRILKRLP